MPNPDDSRVIVSAPPGRKPTISTSGLPGMSAGRRGLPLAVPLPFLLTGACAAALFGLLLPWVMPEAIQAPDFPHVLALVHVATLGWLTMTFMGSMQSREEDATSAQKSTTRKSAMSSIVCSVISNSRWTWQ